MYVYTLILVYNSGEDQQAFEVNGQSVSSFMSSVESSLEKGGGYMDVFERVQESKLCMRIWSRVCVTPFSAYRKN